jgi:excinuclease ABC subunit C
LGPYLGGDRVRLAMSALQRVFPLAYAGDGLTAFERALARTRAAFLPTHPGSSTH